MAGVAVEEEGGVIGCDAGAEEIMITTINHSEDSILLLCVWLISEDHSWYWK